MLAAFFNNSKGNYTERCESLWRCDKAFIAAAVFPGPSAAVRNLLAKVGGPSLSLKVEAFRV